MSNNLKIIFMGNPGFGSIILKGLLENNYRPVLVITSPDKPVGRKQILTPSPVKVIAQKYSIPLLQLLRIGKGGARRRREGGGSSVVKLKIKNLKPDLIIVTAYGQIIPKEILDIPQYGSLNIHPSLLPKYRGPSPIQTAILNGDKKTGVTIFLMDEKTDHGKIISNFQFSISNKKISHPELSKKLAKLGAELLIKTIPKWIKGEIKTQPQNESKAIYTKILKKEDGRINWSESAENIERKIRAFYSWPGTFTFWQKKRLKIIEAEIKDLNKDLTPGKTFEENNFLCVKCKNKSLIPTRRRTIAGPKLSISVNNASKTSMRATRTFTTSE